MGLVEQIFYRINYTLNLMGKRYTPVSPSEQLVVITIIVSDYTTVMLRTHTKKTHAKHTEMRRHCLFRGG